MTGRSNLKTKRKSFRWGVWAETYAAFILRLKGYRKLETRYKTPVGEIDLIFKSGNTLVFVEVKYRKNLLDAQFSISLTQQKRIMRAAGFYQASHDCRGLDMRFDAFYVSPWGRFKHLCNAWIA